jgi:hypothetical protein
MVEESWRISENDLLSDCRIGPRPVLSLFPLVQVISRFGGLAVEVKVLIRLGHHTKSTEVGWSNLIKNAHKQECDLGTAGIDCLPAKLWFTEGVSMDDSVSVLGVGHSSKWNRHLQIGQS